jgi:NAD(P)-dependent dehydrogenase (short-subunit alcohol dehydrogenase family)
MKIKDSVPFVTGANRGLGLAFVRELLARGAKKVYAGVRNPDRIDLPGVIPIKLDVTNPDDVAAAAAQCGDTTLLINNAGIARYVGFLDPTTIAAAREIFETNFYGPIRMSQTFAPILAAHGGGAIINVLSVASWINTPLLAPYGASKSAAWGFTNGLRIELLKQNTQVLGLHVGFIDTDLTKDLEFAKIQPADVVTQTLDGLEAGLEEVLADEITRMVKDGLSKQPGIYLAPLQR